MLAGILVGQLDITISPLVKSVFFIMFLFAVGYGVGPQFVRGIATDGAPQALFAVLTWVAAVAPEPVPHLSPWVGEAAKSNVPVLGYTVPYAVANTTLTLWGLVIVLMVT